MKLRRLIIGGAAALALAVGAGSAAIATAEPAGIEAASKHECAVYKEKAQDAYAHAKKAAAAGDAAKYKYYMGLSNKYKLLLLKYC